MEKIMKEYQEMSKKKKSFNNESERPSEYVNEKEFMNYFVEFEYDYATFISLLIKRYLRERS